MSLQEIKDVIPTLTHEERKELLDLLIATFAQSGRSEPPTARRHSLRELRGFGKEIWRGIDAQQYIGEQRDEWDRRP